MKKRGFTLVELLAVIVILAIIALIAIPLIGNVIEKAKIGALESSVNGLVESANMYYANNTIKGETISETTFDFEDGEQISTQKLEYKGKVYNGKLILHANGEVAVCIDDEKYYAYKNKDTAEIVSGTGICLYDGTTGDFTIESDADVIRKECEADKQELQNQIEELSSHVNELMEISTNGIVYKTTGSSITFTPTTNYFVAAGQGGREQNMTVSATNAELVGDITVPIATGYTVTNGLALWKVKDISQSVTVSRGGGGNYGHPYMFVREVTNVPDSMSELVGGEVLSTQGDVTVPIGTKMVLWTGYPETWYNGRFTVLENLVILPAFDYNQSNGTLTYAAIVQDPTKEAKFSSSVSGNYNMNKVRYRFFQ